MKGREGERNIPSFPPVFFMTTRAIAALLRLWAMIFIPAHASGPMFRWLQKALVIQQLIHLFQLGRQRTKRFWQDRIPKRQLVLPQIQHFHHPEGFAGAGHEFLIFWREQIEYQEILSPFDYLFCIHSAQQSTPNPLPRPVFRPLLQSPPTGGGRTILSRHVRPGTTCFQHDSVQGFSRIGGRTSGSRFGFGKQGFNNSVRLSAHVSYSCFHFTLIDHIFEIACTASASPIRERAGIGRLYPGEFFRKMKKIFMYRKTPRICQNRLNE